MSVSYDGKLVLNVNKKEICPCCEEMHNAVAGGYAKPLLSKSRSIVAITLTNSVEVRRHAIQHCPWCGTKVEIIERGGV